MKTLEEMLPFAPELNTRTLNLEDALSYNIYRDSKSERRVGNLGITNHRCVWFPTPEQIAMFASLDSRGHDWQPPRP